MDPLSYHRGLHGGPFSPAHRQAVSAHLGSPYPGPLAGFSPGGHRRKSCPPNYTLMTSHSSPAFDSLMEEDSVSPWTSLYEENSMEEPMQMSPNTSQREFRGNTEMTSPLSALTSALLDLDTSPGSPRNRHGTALSNTNVSFSQSPGRRNTMHGTPVGYDQSNNNSKTFEGVVCRNLKKTIGMSLTGSTSVPQFHRSTQDGKNPPVNKNFTKEGPPYDEQKITEDKLDVPRMIGDKDNVHISQKEESKSPARKRIGCKTVFLAVMTGFIAAAGMLIHVFEIGSGPRCLSFLNMTSLDVELENRVFGQHIATEFVRKSLEQYLNFEKAGKPLVLSFHGWTGIGKNHLSNIVAEHVTEKCVQKIIIPLHFPHVGEGFENGAQIFKWITGSVFSSGCCLSLFIVDEMDKADDDLISGIETTILNITGRLEIEPDSPKVVILLLSNTGGVAINQYILHRMQNGASRHDIQLEQLVSVLTHMRTTPWHMRPLEAGLITSLVPFMPLERRHVRRCLMQHAERFGHEVERELLEKALDQLSFVPKQEQLFSKTGCRKIYALFDLLQDVSET